MALGRHWIDDHDSSFRRLRYRLITNTLLVTQTAVPLATVVTAHDT